MYLLLGLSLLHHLPAHFNPGREDGAGEVGHVDALQVTHLLCGYEMRRRGGQRGEDADLQNW